MYFIDTPRSILMVVDSEKEADKKIAEHGQAFGTLTKREWKPATDKKHSKGKVAA